MFTHRHFCLSTGKSKGRLAQQCISFVGWDAGPVRTKPGFFRQQVTIRPRHMPDIEHLLLRRAQHNRGGQRKESGCQGSGRGRQSSRDGLQGLPEDCRRASGEDKSSGGSRQRCEVLAVVQRPKCDPLFQTCRYDRRYTIESGIHLSSVAKIIWNLVPLGDRQQFFCHQKQRMPPSMDSEFEILN